MSDALARRESIKEFRVQIRLRNNRMLRLREEIRMTQAEFARACGIAPTSVCALETLRESPIVCGGNRDGEWTRAALMIAAFHGVSPEWLWPDVVKQQKRSVLQLEINENETASVAYRRIAERETGHLLNAAMLELSPREKKLLSERFVHGKTFEQIGQRRKLSRERVRQMEQRAMHKLRKRLKADELEIVVHPAGETKDIFE